LRTDYLFRLANQRRGIVLGTGDLSEMALGWCTYGVGDQMSHYAVNSGVPKTLIQFLIRWCIRTDQYDATTDAILSTILAQEISPELVPAGADGALQSTESMIGPYALNDFFAHYVIRHGLAPSKIAFLAWHAWRDASVGAWPEDLPADARVAYDLPTIRHWLEKFLFRFFTILSNMLCAFACLLVLVFRIVGNVPASVLVLKYVGTSCVTLTFLTVMVFLGPFVYSYKQLLSGPDLFFHAVNPLLAIVSYLAWDRAQGSFSHVLLGTLPVFLYACLYLKKVVLDPEEKRWEDFYGLNKGHWLFSFIIMVAAGFLISVVLWSF
jgi:hypothetical protein